MVKLETKLRCACGRVLTAHVEVGEDGYHAEPPATVSERWRDEEGTGEAELRVRCACGHDAARLLPWPPVAGGTVVA